LLGYAHALNGEFEIAVPLLETALERSKEIHLPYLTSSTGGRLGETLALQDSKRALDVAENAARAGLELAEKLGLGPEQGHCLRTLGDIIAARGDAVKANELHDLARARFRSLGDEALGRKAVAALHPNAAA
jgi:hypothetical protein